VSRTRRNSMRRAAVRFTLSRCCRRRAYGSSRPCPCFPPWRGVIMKQLTVREVVVVAHSSRRCLPIDRLEDRVNRREDSHHMWRMYFYKERELLVR
jgi:hypothetical protein